MPTRRYLTVTLIVDLTLGNSLCPSRTRPSEGQGALAVHEDTITAYQDGGKTYEIDRLGMGHVLGQCTYSKLQYS